MELCDIGQIVDRAGGFSAQYNLLIGKEILVSPGDSCVFFKGAFYITYDRFGI